MQFYSWSTAAPSAEPSTCNVRDDAQFQQASHSRSQCNTSHSQSHANRRQAVLGTAALAAGLLLPRQAHASKLPVFADNIWEAMGGGPSDLTFPDSFLGVWDVTSTLITVDTPLGEDMVPDMAVVRRARAEDLDKPMAYQVAFIRNPKDGRVIFDRAFNMAAMLSDYTGRTTEELVSRMQWNPTDPNVLTFSMPGGLSIRTRVTRRSQDQPAPDRIDTSEFVEQVFDSSAMRESSASGPRVKASQCFTKFKWRDQARLAPGQPAIVATQVVSDYLTPMQGGDDAAYLAAMNRPVTVYTWRMALVRHA